ncbi:hypothetical protein VPHD148_0309 [Vibrio phage D148]
MATIINPITTVLLNRQEFDSGEFERFPFKYILEDEGTISYFSRLTAGRYLLSHEAQIKGLGRNKQAIAPIAEFQPLAYGHKIPAEMFNQVKQFFLDVMDLGPSTYEAQIFIVWNETSKDYRIVIPKQKVSAAAVRYDIGEMLSDDDVIICDIHSHNNMSAFFSGTDNNDDKKNPWISGVFGKLSTSMEHKFRFNDGAGRHFEMKAEDVFDFADARFQTPKEWLDQVELSTYTPVKQANGLRSWESKLDHPGNSGARGSDWTSPAEYDMGGGAGWDDMFSSPEDDLYDSIVDDLNDLSNDECKAVLDAIECSIGNPEFAPTLTDRETTAFVSVHYSIHSAKDDNMSREVVNQLKKAY